MPIATWKLVKREEKYANMSEGPIRNWRNNPERHFTLCILNLINSVDGFHWFAISLSHVTFTCLICCIMVTSCVWFFFVGLSPNGDLKYLKLWPVKYCGIFICLSVSMLSLTFSRQTIACGLLLGMNLDYYEFSRDNMVENLSKSGFASPSSLHLHVCNTRLFVCHGKTTCSSLLRDQADLNHW